MSNDRSAGESRPRRDTDPPTDLLEAHPETAYFWGRVIGDGEVTVEGITVRTNDEIAADRLASIAGADSVDHRTEERVYAHDTSITRTEDTWTVRVEGSVGERAAGALGLPFEGDPGGYRLVTLDEYARHLLRGLFESCGTICFKASSGTVGLSFVADDRTLLTRIGELLDEADVDAPHGDLSETSAGGFWFSIEDEAAPAFGKWLYADPESTGLCAPSRRRKLERSLEEVAGD